LKKIKIKNTIKIQNQFLIQTRCKTAAEKKKHKQTKAAAYRIECDESQDLDFAALADAVGAILCL
jgi:hypothetical protein